MNPRAAGAHLQGVQQGVSEWMQHRLRPTRWEGGARHPRSLLSRTDNVYRAMPLSRRGRWSLFFPDCFRALA